MAFARNILNCSDRAMLAGAVLSIFCLSVPAVLASEDEEIFEHAKQYTVQIRTTVNMAFKEDEKSSWMGAGFIVDEDRAWVLTNAHVAAHSPSQVRVRLNDGDYQEAKKVYVDPYLDLAVLQLAETQRKNLVSADLDCSDLPNVGHPVGAFGHPWGLTNTGTRGIVSGVTSRFGGEKLQIDAPINGGNSGGPLLSLKTGKVVGISTSQIDEDDDQNTNFAEPMKYACHILNLLRSGRDPSPPQLSIAFSDDIDNYDLLTVGESYLDDHLLSLQSGDIILRVSGTQQNIRNEGQLIDALRGRLDSVEMYVLRQGKELLISGRLNPAVEVLERQGVFVSGLMFAPAGFRDNPELNLNHPLLVHSVDYGSLGESLEIEKWDILTRVNGMPIDGLREFYDRLDEARRNGGSIRLVLKRWSASRNRIYDYLQRELPIEDLQFIGPNFSPQTTQEDTIDSPGYSMTSSLSVSDAERQ